MPAFLLFILCVGFTSAGAPKGKAPTSKVSLMAPTISPSPAVIVSTTTTQSTQSTQSSTTGNQSMILLDLKTVASDMFKLVENGKFTEAAALFAPGMSYITNGRVYELDLSIPADIKSIPKRNRTQIIWTYTDSDDYELWGRCFVKYPGAAPADPEFLIIHFNKMGKIDMFSHIQPKAAQCTAMVKEVVKLALMRPDGTVVDAPQDQLARMMAAQEAAKKTANGTVVSNTTTTTTTSTSTTNTTISG